MSAEQDARRLNQRAQHLRMIMGWTDNPAFKAMLLEEAEKAEAEANRLLATDTLPHAAAVPSGEPPIARSGAAMKQEAPPGPSNDDDHKP